MSDYREKELAALGINASVVWDGHSPAVVTLDIKALDGPIGLASMTGDIENARLVSWSEGKEYGREKGYAEAIADLKRMAGAA